MARFQFCGNAGYFVTINSHGVEYVRGRKNRR